MGRQTSIYLYADMEKELDKLQEETKRSRSYLINEALRQYISNRIKES